MTTRSLLRLAILLFGAVGTVSASGGQVTDVFRLLQQVADRMVAIDAHYPNGRDRIHVTRQTAGSIEEIVWRIDDPTVTTRETVYDSITFRPGDQISIRAGGCVQTGGKGDTWKAYVHPTGDDTARRYHGLLWIPAVTGGALERIEGVLAPKSYVVPGNVPTVGAGRIVLHLGYEDDEYKDNGYYAKDNGNDDQCKNVSDAWVELTVRRGLPAPTDAYSTHAAPFDLVWKQVDANLVPLNPIWAYQIDHPGQRPALGTGCATIQGPLRFAQYFDAPCTSQKPSFDLSEQFLGFVGVCNGDVLDGHANWMIATYDGTIKWESHSNPTFGDDDYNFGLYRPDNAGLTGGGDGLGLEFEARETIDTFTTNWWVQFHRAVDGTLPGVDPQTLVNGKYAIVTGLFGIDGVHGGWAESHPVYAMAIRVSSSATPDGKREERWAFFLRNWGNEGQCSHEQHYFDPAGDSYYIQLPWQAGAGSVDVVPDKTVIKTNFASTVPVSFERADGEWLYLKAHLPSGQGEPRMHGEIVLRWSAPATQGQTLAATIAATEATVRTLALPARSHPVEQPIRPRGLEQIVDAAQRQVVENILTSSTRAGTGEAAADSDVSTVVTTVLPHPASAVDPRTVAPLKDKHAEDPRQRTRNDAIRQQLEAQFGQNGERLRRRR